MSGYALDIPNRLTVYGNEAVKTFYQRAFDLEGRQDDTRLHYQVIQPYSRIKKKEKLVTDKTIYVANHFSHNGGLSYAEMAALSQKHEIITSYDGLEILT